MVFELQSRRNDMWNDADITVKNLYGMEKTKEVEEAEARRAVRVAEVIKEMGDRYCLAIPVKKKSESKEWMI